MGTYNQRRNIVISGIIAIFILIAVFLFMLFGIKKTYQINFYQDVNLLGSYVLDSKDRIDDDILEEVYSKAYIEEDYKYYWSFSNNELNEVDFSKLNKDSDIYLYKEKVDEVFDIIVEEHEFFNYEIISDDLITEDSNAVIRINHLVDKNRYKAVVYINDVISYPNENDEYEIKNIQSDVYVKVKYYEILEIKSNMKDHYYYTGSNILIDYGVYDINNSLVDINDIEVIITNSNNEVVDEILEVGTYNINYHYTGTTYYVDDYSEEIIVEKEKLSINPILEDEYVFNNQIIEFDYRVLNSLNEIVDIDDISISYYDEQNQIIDNIIDAGRYSIKYHYTGLIYDIDDVVVNVVVNKQVSNIFVENKEFIYDGNVKEITIDDVVTNSDGAITFENNNNINVGKYEVVVKVEESKNYLENSFVVSLTITKATPIITNTPDVNEGYEKGLLSDIDLTNGSSNVDGRFVWKDQNQELVVGNNKYKVLFIPTDSLNYNQVEFEIEVNTISITEMLRRIKVDRNDVYDELRDVLVGNIDSINKLPIKADKYGSQITWYSNSNIIKVDNLGNIHYLDVDCETTINLVGYINLYNAVEYVSFVFTLNHQTEEVLLTEEVEEEVNEPIELSVDYEIDNNQTYYINPYQEIRNNIEVKTNETNDEFENIEYQETNIIVYESKCNDLNTISEIILWKILTDSAGDHVAYKTNEIKQERYIDKNMKGEHNI